MTQKYFALLTSQGAARLANAAALGTQLQITQMAVGDGGGTLPVPDPAQTALIGEKRRAVLNSLSIDTANSSQIIAEQVIPESEGGFWIREIGLFDADGVLIAVANCAETYKPQLAEGSGRVQTVRMMIIVNSTSAITLKIDPSVVLATRQYVDNQIIEVRQYADKLIADHVAEENPHTQYLLIKNALTEMAEAGLIADVLKNLSLSDIALAGVATGAVGTTGYISLPLIIGGGKQNLIIQWGYAAFTVQTTTTVTLPVSFPTRGLIALASKGSNIAMAGEYAAGVQISKSTITVSNSNQNPSGSQGINWAALGY